VIALLSTLRSNVALAIGVAAAILIAAAYLYGDHNGANRVKARVTAERAAANEKALTTDLNAKEQASIERTEDTANIEEKHDAQVNAIRGGDDAAIRRSAACQRLRATPGRSEADLPEQCRSGN
jgi:hypothetical protein